MLASSVRRRASPTARSNSVFIRGAKISSGFDGVLAVAQLVRETDLPEIGVSLLGTVEVGNPDAGSMAIEHIGHHAGSTAVADDVNDHLLVLEHPVPVGAAIDALEKQMKAAEHEITSNPGAAESTLRVPDQVHEHLLALEAGFEGEDDAPTAAMMDQMKLLRPQYETALEKFSDFLKTDVTAFNRTMAEHKLTGVVAGEPVQPPQPRPIKGMRLAVPTTVALDELDDEVARSFERALENLSRQGALIERIEAPR